MFIRVSVRDGKLVFWGSVEDMECGELVGCAYIYILAGEERDGCVVCMCGLRTWELGNLRT